MRIRVGSSIFLLVGLSALTGGCNTGKGTSSEAPAGAAGAALNAAPTARSVTPTLGGSVVALGEHQVELAILENGLVQAQVYDAHGQALAATAAPKLSVALRTRGGGRPVAALEWNATHARLQGRALLQAGLVADPIDVTLELGAQHATGTLEGYAILPFARFGGSVLAVGPYALELVSKPEAILAYVLDASGKTQGGAELSLQLQVGAAPGTPLDFKWDPARAGYSAALDAQQDISSEPLQLGLTASGRAYTGATSSLKALAAARLDARAELGGGASAKIEVPAPRVDTQLKAPGVKLHKSASASASAKSSKAKASASVKGSASFGFGK